MIIITYFVMTFFYSQRITMTQIEVMMIVIKSDFVDISVYTDHHVHLKNFEKDGTSASASRSPICDAITSHQLFSIYDRHF